MGAFVKTLLGLVVGGMLIGSTAAQAQLPQLPTLGGNPAPTYRGNPYGSDSNSPRIYEPDGTFRGNLNSNRYDPDSIANPYGRYGSPYSPDSLNNPYGPGSPYR